MTQIGLLQCLTVLQQHIFILPKFLSVLAEGYRFASLRKDVMAALTVAIVALPLSMAIAVASGVSPERGLYTAVIGGFLVSARGKGGRGHRFSSMNLRRYLIVQIELARSSGRQVTIYERDSAEIRRSYSVLSIQISQRRSAAVHSRIVC